MSKQGEVFLLFLLLVSAQAFAQEQTPPSAQSLMLDGAAARAEEAAKAMAAPVSVATGPTLAVPSEPQAQPAPAPGAPPPPPGAPPPPPGAPPPVEPPPAPMAVAAASPPPPHSSGGFVVGVGFDYVVFFDTPRSSLAPLPELLIGSGDENFRALAIIGDTVGTHAALTLGLRLQGGSTARPVGYNFGVDLQLEEVFVDPWLLDLTGVVSPVILSFRLAKGVLLEARLANIGLTLNTTSDALVWSFGGGLAVSLL